MDAPEVQVQVQMQVQMQRVQRVREADDDNDGETTCATACIADTRRSGSKGSPSQSMAKMQAV